VQLVFKVLLVQLALQVHKVHQGLQALLDQQVPKDLKDRQALLALQVHKA
jgi:hypothetical protein